MIQTRSDQQTALSKALEETLAGIAGQTDIAQVIINAGMLLTLDRVEACLSRIRNLENAGTADAGKALLERMKEQCELDCISARDSASALKKALNR